MICQFPQANPARKGEIRHKQPDRGYIIGIESKDLITTEGGSVLAQYFEDKQAQIWYYSVQSEHSEVFSVRSELQSWFFLFNLEGNALFQEHIAGSAFIRRETGILLLQDQYQGYGTIFSSKHPGRFLIISLSNDRASKRQLKPLSREFGITALIADRIRLLFKNQVNVYAIQQITEAVWQQIEKPVRNYHLDERESGLLDAFKNEVDKHPGKNIPASQWSTDEGISPKRFSGGFKAKFGKTIKQYVRESRLQHSWYAVHDTTKPLKQISKETGFRSYSNFCASFKDFFGQTPGDTRKEN